MRKIILVFIAILLTCMSSCSNKKFKPDPYFVIDPVGNLIFPASGGSQTVKIKSNLLSWELRQIVPQGWCKVEKNPDGAPNFTITASENLDTLARQDAVIEVVGQNDELTITERMKISQVGAEKKEN